MSPLHRFAVPLRRRAGEEPPAAARSAIFPAATGRAPRRGEGGFPRRGFAGGLALITLATATLAHAEPKARLVGELDRTLRKQIELAVGEVKTRPDGRLEARRRARDAAASAEALLRSEGYYEAIAEPAVSESEPPVAEVKITPGPRFHFAAARIDWVGPPPAAEVAGAAIATMKLTDGAPGRAAEVIAAEGRLVAVLRAKGYADANADPREVVVDHADHSVRPTFRLAAHDLVRLDGIKLVTNGRTRKPWVRKLAPWSPGQVYDPKALARLQQRLLDARVYESATVSLAPAADATGGLRPVEVTVVDRRPRTIELGASYSTTEGSGVDGKWIHYNLLGRADTLTLTAKAYDIQQILDLELDQPDWRRADQILKVGGGFLGDITPAYNDAGAGVRADVERHWTKTSFVTAGLSLDYAYLRDKTAINAQGLPVGQNLNLGIGTLLGGVTLDKSNDPLNPVRGWRLDARLEPTGITGDEQLVYLKTQAQVSGYLPFGADADTVAAARFKVGAILGGSIPAVPADRRFYAGGGGSVRGFGYQAVGPRLADNVTPEGGLSLMEASFELRRRIKGPFGIVAFVDAGSVGTTSAPTVSNIGVGAGLGLRYDLGFGPLRLDIGTPVNPRPGDAPVQVYISIGQAF